MFVLKWRTCRNSLVRLSLDGPKLPDFTEDASKIEPGTARASESTSESGLHGVSAWEGLPNLVAEFQGVGTLAEGRDPETLRCFEFSGRKCSSPTFLAR